MVAVFTAAGHEGDAHQSGFGIGNGVVFHLAGEIQPGIAAVAVNATAHAPEVGQIGNHGVALQRQRVAIHTAGLHAAAWPHIVYVDGEPAVIEFVGNLLRHFCLVGSFFFCRLKCGATSAEHQSKRK